MNKKSIILFVFFCGFIGFASAQQISWTGNIDKISLFNKSNWLDEGTSQAFTSNMASGVAINRDVYFGPTATIGTDKEVKGMFDTGSGFLKFKKTNIRTDYSGVTGFKSANSITLDSAIVLTGSVSSPSIVLSGNSQLHLYESEAISADTKINILGENAWVYFHSLSPQQVIDTYAKQISVDGIAAIVGSSLRIAQYYDGAVAIPHRSSIKALYLYSGANLTGVSKYFRVSHNTSYYGNIGANGTNKAASFFLKKGYMATIAQNQNGTGASKVYIAEDNDIIINGNINGKNDTVNFVRVAPWRWITKKGVGGNYTNFNADWYYNWGSDSQSTVDKEFVPMQWGQYWPSIDSNVESLKTRPDITHFLGFNEPDHTDQSNMTVDQCLALWPKLMETGLRLGSPAMTDIVKLNEFMDKAIARGYRVDFICLHNYEKRTGDNYVNTICKPFYDKYKIPVWVTEFSYGASWNSNINEILLNFYNGEKDYINKMDASPYVERYALYPWSNIVVKLDSLYSSFEKYTGTSKDVLSARGVYYREFEGIPSRGNPFIYRSKIAKAKQAIIDAAATTILDNKCFSFISRNNDGTSRRKIQISANATKLNNAYIGGDGTATSSTGETFLFKKIDENRYKLKVNSNCLFLSVRNDSVVVEAESTSDKQIWEFVAITGTNFVALKNLATGKFINPLANSMALATLITTISSTDITAMKAAHWEITASSVCGCIDPSLGVFNMNVFPLSGNAPLTVTMTGEKRTKENKEAFYRWYNFQGTDTIVSTYFNDEYTYTQPGNYRIQVRGRDYVSRITVKEFNIKVNAPSSVDNTTNQGINIYPNPIQNELNIEGIPEGKHLSIYDVQGRLVLQNTFNGKSIKTDQLPAGFYVLKCDGFVPLKLLKK